MCKIKQCKYYDEFFDDNCGGNNESNCIRLEELERVLSRVKDWCSAYPLEMFPEPDFKKVHTVLKKNNLTLDAISASNMRHVVTGIQKIIDETL